MTSKWAQYFDDEDEEFEGEEEEENLEETKDNQSSEIVLEEFMIESEEEP